MCIDADFLRFIIDEKRARLEVAPKEDVPKLRCEIKQALKLLGECHAERTSKG